MCFVVRVFILTNLHIKRLLSLLFLCKIYDADKEKQVAGIVPAIEKARLYRGKGGEIMRSAVSRFIECISLAHVQLTEKIKRSLLDTLNENLRHPNSHIQVLQLFKNFPVVLLKVVFLY